MATQGETPHQRANHARDIATVRLQQMAVGHYGIQNVRGIDGKSFRIKIPSDTTAPVYVRVTLTAEP